MENITQALAVLKTDDPSAAAAAAPNQSPRKVRCDKGKKRGERFLNKKP